MKYFQDKITQRLRVRFARGLELAFISHLDLMRFWERVLRRAGLPLSYTQGFSPHPRISLAAPLALGVTSEAEIMDIYLSRWISPHNFIQSLRRQLPPGIQVHEANTVPPDIPSLQSQVRYAEYMLVVEREGGPEDVSSALQHLMATKSLMWQHIRDTGIRSYDLRALIDKLWLVSCNHSDAVIGMRLRCGPSGAGRPEQVIAALGFPGLPHSIHRNKLILEAPRGKL
ncbi:TIGR03936 family radical SAM-associated protein [Chloroflexota bacterium]